MSEKPTLEFRRGASRNDMAQEVRQALADADGAFFFCWRRNDGQLQFAAFQADLALVGPAVSAFVDGAGLLPGGRLAVPSAPHQPSKGQEAAFGLRLPQPADPSV